MKCIVSDFDGTLLDNNIEENISSVKDFVNNGNIFVLATGRTFKSIKEAIKNYNIPYEYLICSDGSCIYDKNDNLIYEKVLSYDLKFKILSTIFDIDDSVEIKYDNNYEKCDSDVKVSRILVNANMDVKEKIMNELNKIGDVYSYLSTNWLNVSSINNDKTIAIKYLEELLNLDKNNIYVIGNDINDFAMIKYYNGYLINNNVKTFKEFVNKINTR